MERRVLIAILLSFLVLYSYQALFVRPTPPASSPAASPAEMGSAAAGGGPAIPVSPAAEAEVSAVSGTPVTADTTEREIRIETETVVAIFTNRGAKLKSWRLKDYLDDNNEPLELIAHDLSPTVVLPFTLKFDDPGVTATLDAVLYSVMAAAPAAPITSATTITFEYADSSGLRATKSFGMQPSGYLVTLDATVVSEGNALTPTVLWGPALGDHDAATGRYTVKARGLYSIADEVTRLTASDVVEQGSRAGRYQFVGVDDHYFITAAVAPGTATVEYQGVKAPPSAGAETERELMAYGVKPDVKGSLTFYVGPKDFDQLAAVDRPLVRAIDFGWFAVVIVPLLRALNWIYGYVGNYGWSIIILTLLINLVMFPLRHKSVVSMRKMQEIQPEAKAIQDRYGKYKATDPEKQKMNQELMALYRERGVNPASGCVPMLLTFPVLIAFYNLLTTAIELRDAPFMGWIHDLSVHDPFYVTPVLMLVSQVWQTKITPQAGADPAQQRMMMLMPVVMMFFFLWAPAGVAIYWFVSNLWAIGQQYATNYLIGPPNIRTVRPAAERRIKRAGSGKTDAAAREN